MDGETEPPSRGRNSRLRAVSILSPSSGEARERINNAFMADRLGSVLPDLWEEVSVYFDGLAEEHLVISLRLVLPSKLGLPIDRHFHTDFLHLEKPCAEISHFTVLPPFRRKIGVYDWDSVKRYAVDAGCQHLIVESLMKLENFYRRLGFVRCGNPFFDPTIASPGSANIVNAVPMLMRLYQFG